MHYFTKLQLFTHMTLSALSISQISAKPANHHAARALDVILATTATQKPQATRTIELLRTLQLSKRNKTQNAIDVIALAREQYTKNIFKKIIRKKRPGTALVNVQHVRLELGMDGYPTTEAIKKMLIEKYFPKKISPKLNVKITHGGSYTERIYCASVSGRPNESVFFLKISNKPISTQNLKKLQESNVGRVGLTNRNAHNKHLIPKKNLPILAWLEDIFTYTNPRGENIAIEVTHSAKGEMVYYVVTDLNNKDVLLRCMRALGTALGSFQQIFMQYPKNGSTSSAGLWTTMCHHDFHLGNVFFDRKTSRVYFIDNETMSPKHCSIFTDIKQLLFEIQMGSTVSNSYHPERFTLYTEGCLAFFAGYIESYPHDQKVAVAKHLRTEIEHANLYSFATYDPNPADTTKKIKRALRWYLKTVIIKSSSPKTLMAEYKISALQIAVVKGSINDVRKIIKNGANVNEPDINGDTALDFAVLEKKPDIIEVLLNAGAKTYKVIHF